LTEQKLRETGRNLHDLRFPNPKSLADALLVHAQKEDIEQFSTESIYGAIQLRNLKSTLHTAGIRNEQIFRKLEAAAQIAEEYGIE